MAISKENSRNNAYKLRGLLKKNGYDRWRFFFSGESKSSEEENTFYIELYIMNPFVSPEKPAFSYNPQTVVSEQELQNVLAGTTEYNTNSEAYSKTPSYVAIRVGKLGKNGTQVNSFYPPEALLLHKKRFCIKIGKCIFTDTLLRGSVFSSTHSVSHSPSYFNSTGTISWNLNYEKQIDFVSGFKNKNCNWISTGTKTIFNGTITVNGEEFVISSKKHAGYIDKNWGKSIPLPWFHLSSSNLSSLISGKNLKESCFAIEGLYENKLCILADIEDQKLVFIPGKPMHTYSASWECTETPSDNDGKKIHWSVSIHDKRHIIDIDVFCRTDELIVRDYELPSGERKLLKILSGGTGSGEIRFYRCIKKTIELIEHARISQAICEYGALELPGK